MANLELAATQETNHPANAEDENEGGNDQSVPQAPLSQADQHSGTAPTQNPPGVPVGQGMMGTHQPGPGRPAPVSNSRNRPHRSVSADGTDYVRLPNHRSNNRVEKAKAKRQEKQRKARNEAIEARLQRRARRHSASDTVGVDPFLLQLTLENILKQGAGPKFETAPNQSSSFDSPGEADHGSDDPYCITFDPILCPGTCKLEYLSVQKEVRG